jgi:hypothetical protein
VNTVHNTSISKVANWPWRLPPADRKDGEVRTYYLTPEELEKYRKNQKGEKKMEEHVIYKNSGVESGITQTKPSLKEILEQDFATGKKSIDEIAKGLNIRPSVVKAAAVRLGYIKKKETQAENPDNGVSRKIEFKAATFNGKFEYRFAGNKILIK